MGSMNAERFQRFIKPNDAIVDFGCGGGALLASAQLRRAPGGPPGGPRRAGSSGRRASRYAFAPVEGCPPVWSTNIAADGLTKPR
jgi:hypothetical protein